MKLGTKNAKVQLLRNVRLFSACSDRELAKIAALADQIEVDKGAVLTVEGRPGGEAFVIASGSATAKLRGKKLATLSEGNFFGEMSLLDHGPRSATITADTPDPSVFGQSYAVTASVEVYGVTGWPRS